MVQPVQDEPRDYLSAGFESMAILLLNGGHGMKVDGIFAGHSGQRSVAGLWKILDSAIEKVSAAFIGEQDRKPTFAG